MLFRSGVRAVVGGRNFKTGAYNAALQGVGRQPGSSFKTFVLAAALDAGISPDSVWESSGFDQLVCGVNWAVDNYEGGGSGPVSVDPGLVPGWSANRRRMASHD